MEEELRKYIEHIFSTVPCTARAVELKEEVLQNLVDKYHDLVAQGKTQQAAYNISVASIGDINELLASVRPQTDESQNSSQNNEEYMKEKRRNGLLTSIAVALYILCPVPCIITEGTVGVVLMFIMVAIATGLLIFKSATKNTYNKNDDTMVEDFKQWQSQDSNKKALYKSISSALWALILVAYFVISFATSAWYITWVIFLIGGALDGLTKAIIDFVNSREV